MFSYPRPLSFVFYFVIATCCIFAQPGNLIPGERFDSARNVIRTLRSESKLLQDTIASKQKAIEQKDEEIRKYAAEVETLKSANAESTRTLSSHDHWLTAFIIAALVAAGVVVFLFISLRGRKLVQKKLERTNATMKRQAEETRKRNKETTDSIRYARRIQEAMLPSTRIMATKLPKSFVLYLPKDIISGDFYWVSEQSGGRVFVATADCTGHGVPGALMSMLGISFLNEIVNEKQIQSPAGILNELKSSIINAITKSDKGDGMKDGIDMSLYCLDKKKMRITYAAANNDLYIIRDDQVIALPADKQPVGASPKDHLPFKESAFELKENDMIVTFTDGFADQFGGPKGKKFKYKQFQRLMVEVRPKPASLASEMLSKFFQKWKGSNEQVDDVLVIGVKI